MKVLARVPSFRVSTLPTSYLGLLLQAPFKSSLGCNGEIFRNGLLCERDYTYQKEDD